MCLSKNHISRKIFNICSSYSVVCAEFSIQVNWVKIDGNEYKISTGVILDVEHDLPVVGVIQDIYLVNEDKILFRVDKSSTSYEPHFRAYILENDSCTRIISHSDLFVHTCVYIRKSHVPDLSNLLFYLLLFVLAINLHVISYYFYPLLFARTINVFIYIYI